MKKQSKLDELIERLQHNRQELEDELERRLKEKRQQFNYNVRKGKVVFERKARSFYIKQRKGSLQYIFEAPFAYLLSAPIIYGMIIPIALMDFSISIYQSICFRIYKISLVKRADFITIDRHRLPYLNVVQKLNCVYCGYGNGVMAYAREVIARTEQYWCPIKHARRTKGLHLRTEKFLDYGDAEAWKEQLVEIRKDWKE